VVDVTAIVALQVPSRSFQRDAQASGCDVDHGDRDG
jgi:hypothetical protein